MKLSTPQDIVFQVHQPTDELEWALEVLRTGSTLLQAENTILLNKVTELKTKLARARNNYSNLLKPPSSDIINPSQQKKHIAKHKKIIILFGPGFFEPLSLWCLKYQPLGRQRFSN